MGKKRKGEVYKIKKFLKKEGKDKRGMGSLEEKTGQEKISKKKSRGIIKWLAIGLVGLASCLPGCKAVEEKPQTNITRQEENFAKLPSGEIVYFQKPVDVVEHYFGGKHNIFRIKTQEGERYFDTFEDTKLLKYDPKTEEITVYSKGMSPEYKIGKIKLKNRKLYKTKEELIRELKRPRRGAPHPVVGF